MPRLKIKKESNAGLDRLVAQAGAQARAAGVEIEPDEYTLEWYRQEWPARKRIFIEREIKVRNAFDGNKIQPLILNDAQAELLEASLESSEDPSLEDFTLKCRRLGISTYYLADYLSDAIMESGHHVRIVAQDPKTLKSLMKSLKEMYTNLRDEIRPLSKYDAKTELEFDDKEKDVTGSRISISTVVAGKEETGRGDTITRLHLTEIPFWQGDAEIAAVALSDAAKGGKISGESTAKGVGDWFHRKYTQGKLGEGDIRAHFFEWWWNRNYRIAGARIIVEGHDWYLLTAGQRLDRMGDETRVKARLTTYTNEERDTQSLPLQSELQCAQQILLHLVRHGYVEPETPWTCDEVAACLAWRRKEIEKKGAKKFRVEYPENDTDPFAQTGGSIFDQTYLQIKCEPRAPEKGHQYVIALDPSMGIEGGDPAAIAIHDRNTGEHVFYWTGFIKQDAQGAKCCELSDQYNDAEIVIESNMGEAAILECERLGYGHRLYRYIDAQTQRDINEGKVSMLDALERARPGLPMTDRLKRLAVGLFEKAWRQGEFKTCSQSLIEEAKVFVQNGNSMGAKSGYHDDEIMANIIAWFIVVTSYVAKVEFLTSGEKLPSASVRGY
jgi:hypothetical protein